MKADRAIFKTCLIAGVFLLGMWAGDKTPIELQCPEQIQGERLVSIHSRGNTISCQYLPAPRGRILNTRSTKS